MNIDEKLTLLYAVEESGFNVSTALKKLDVPRTTYYRWRSKHKRFGPSGLKDRKPIAYRKWNALSQDEIQKVLDCAYLYPEKSSRELSFFITDSEDFSVSESTVFRILKSKGLIKEKGITGFPAGKEYSVKPQRVNEQWQTDATYLHVKGWGWYYLISVLDDFSRKILAWELKPSMTAEDFIDVIDKACDKSNIDSRDMPNLVSDRGPALILDDLKAFLEFKKIHHILASPYHPQTNGNIERYHKSLKEVIKRYIYDCPNKLKAEIGKFNCDYNKNRYHESIGNVAPDDIFFGKRDEIIKERREKKRLTIARRKEYNSLGNNFITC